MADTITVLEVQDMDVFIEGKGSETIVMVHGWPDTWRLWDGQVELLKKNYRCVRFSLPGFDIAKKRRHYTGQQVIDAIAAVVDQVSPKGKVTLMLHDWGCVYGYQYYMQHQDRVSRIVGVDVGDARSKHMKLPLKMVLFSPPISCIWPKPGLSTDLSAIG
jgi:pimeloyl-ACP methyl ester carboxylesterase